VRADSKLVRYVSLVRQVWLEDVVIRFSFDTVKKVIVGGVEQVSNGRRCCSTQTVCICLRGNPPHSYGASPAIWDQWITEYCLPPNTGECVLHESQPDRPVLDLPTPEGWKAELT